MEIYWTRDAAKVVPRSMSAMLTIVEHQSQSFGRGRAVYAKS
jgi:hypothetical protein